MSFAFILPSNPMCGLHVDAWHTSLARSAAIASASGRSTLVCLVHTDESEELCLRNTQRARPNSNGLWSRINRQTVFGATPSTRATSQTDQSSPGILPPRSS